MAKCFLLWSEFWEPILTYYWDGSLSMANANGHTNRDARTLMVQHGCRDEKPYRSFKNISQQTRKLSCSLCPSERAWMTLLIKVMRDALPGSNNIIEKL